MTKILEPETKVSALVCCGDLPRMLQANWKGEVQQHLSSQEVSQMVCESDPGIVFMSKYKSFILVMMNLPAR